MKVLTFITVVLLVLLTAVKDGQASIRLDAVPPHNPPCEPGLPCGEAVKYPFQLLSWDANGATMMAWIYVVNDRQSDTALLQEAGAGILYIDASRRLSLYTGSSIVHIGSTVVPVGQWHHFALVKDNATPPNWQAYYDGVPDISGTSLVTPTGDPELWFGNDKYGSWLDGRIAAGKIWQASLTQTEIQAEMQSFSAVRTANIWSVVPMHVHTDLTDQSGQGHPPFAVGTLSTEADPPIGPTSATISGQVTYLDSVSPVNNVLMTLSGGQSQTVSTDANGNYSFTVPLSASYTVTPSKTGDIRGLQSFDASFAARYVAGLEVPTAAQRLAADADGDGTLTSFDASLIARYVAGLSGTGIVGNWKFLPTSRTYSPLTGNQSAQNFAAILVGDTSGDWPSPASPNTRPASSSIRRVFRDYGGGQKARLTSLRLTSDGKIARQPFDCKRDGEFDAQHSQQGISFDGLGVLSWDLQAYLDPKPKPPFTYAGRVTRLLMCN